MKHTSYEDFKYSMQDISRLYVGCKYTFAELLEEDDILFKFRMLMQKYILPEADPEDSLETHLYYLEPTSFCVKIYTQMKARVRVNVIEEKRGLLGKSRREYVTRVFDVAKLAGMTREEKEACGLVVQELSVSKLALTGL
ncbi:MAG: hypothetical protein NC432_12400 [Roseburia sp.]|nr:hypothetical protein [Roseburia sp.]MCM1096476.1 hypothetical protein [Ruminococcus flavefaciens]